MFSLSVAARNAGRRHDLVEGRPAPEVSSSRAAAISIDGSRASTTTDAACPVRACFACNLPAAKRSLELQWLRGAMGKRSVHYRKACGKTHCNVAFTPVNGSTIPSPTFLQEFNTGATHQAHELKRLAKRSRTNWTIPSGKLRKSDSIGRSQRCVH